MPFCQIVVFLWFFCFIKRHARGCQSRGVYFVCIFCDIIGRINAYMEIKFFDNLLEKFISNLEKPTIAKILRTIDLLESFGQQLTMPHSKKVDNT